MPVLKVLLIVAGVAVLLFIGMLVIALVPATKNVSGDPALRPLLNRPLQLKKDGFLYFCSEGEYRFRPYVLHESGQAPGTNRQRLPAGSTITLRAFKTYKNRAGSGLTSLYALGEIVTPSGKNLQFEYDWGSTDRFFTMETTDPGMRPAIWQDSSEARVVFPGN